MSFQAMAWAVEFDLPVKQKMVLLMLANRTNNDTGRCDPSMDRLAKDCGMSKTSVKEAIRALKERGLVVSVERRVGEVNLPNLYELNMRENPGVGRETPQGRAPRAPGVGRETPPNLESQPGIKPDSSADADLFGSQKTDEEVKERSAEIRDAFEGFWRIYPKSKRKTDRPKAFEIYRRIVRGQHRTIPKTDPWVIHAGLAKFAASGPDPDYVPLPTTWLNGARWEADYGSAPAEARRRPFAAPDWERVER